ncbi:hypothetical protein OCH239_12240 [Roseivivax halodurans JCM 10272]|uniref:Uncharacterized protein n=1 Tax=Roseivivax halodurans JCM 10272 TaxID=1449350 RepID=X7EJ79_9RHOB|nr:hypothetical protein OCH239_12240 [Roseivivax halodurans JCM 10272]
MCNPSEAVGRAVLAKGLAGRLVRRSYFFFFRLEPATDSE